MGAMVARLFTPLPISRRTTAAERAEARVTASSTLCARGISSTLYADRILGQVLMHYEGRVQPRAVATGLAASASAAALSVTSQVKVSSVRPKCPNEAVLR